MATTSSGLEVITGRVIISARRYSNRLTARNKQPSDRGRTLGSNWERQLNSAGSSGRRLTRIKVEKREEKAPQVLEKAGTRSASLRK